MYDPNETSSVSPDSVRPAVKALWRVGISADLTAAKNNNYLHTGLTKTRRGRAHTERVEVRERSQMMGGRVRTAEKVKGVKEDHRAVKKKLLSAAVEVCHIIKL